MMNWKRSGAALCLALGLLAGCAWQRTEKDHIPAAAPAPEPEARTFFVQYMFRDLQLSGQTVAEGERPEGMDFSRDGLVFQGWRDSTGKPAVPEDIPASRDAVYTVAAYPDLSRHVPFLFPDASGLLRPDDPITGAQLRAAVEALAVPAAEPYLPELPTGEDPVTGAELTALLQELFSPEAVEKAAAELSAAEAVSRSAAAELLESLLGRRCDRITLRPGAALPLDAAKTRPDFFILAEACVSHTPDPEGEVWREARLLPVHGPGFFLSEGKLYYFLDSGEPLTDGIAPDSTLYFGPDGVYTSGSAELDALVTEILASLAAERPEAERQELLRAAYDYSRDSFTYLRKAYYLFGATGWEIDSALDMFRTKLGNCYNYAAAFWALARGLGYDARAYSGNIGTDPHGWVEITFDGVSYVFDPELEMAEGLNGQANSHYMLSPQMGQQFGGYYRNVG